MKILSHLLMTLLLLFAFSTPVLSQTDTKIIESPESYGQIQCIDYSFSDFEKDLIVNKLLSNRVSIKHPTNYVSGSQDPDMDSLNTSVDITISADRQRMYTYTASSGNVSYIKRLTLGGDHGPQLIQHHPIE